MTRVAYLGPEGTFTHEAARHWAAADTELVPLEDIRDVYAAVEGHAVDSAVVAIENSVAGYVVPSLDLLLDAEVVAVDEVAVDITFDAFVLPGSTGEPLVAVSHPHGLAQCQQFVLRRGLPTRASTSNAAACRDLRPAEVAIGPRSCGELYGLEVLERSVEDFAGARTRFLFIVRRADSRDAVRAAASTGSVHTMIAVTPQATGPGVLARITTTFADRSINLTSLITRPLRGRASKYCFVMTLQGHPSNDDVHGALEELLDAGDLVRTLGVFPSVPAVMAGELRDVVPRGSVSIGSSAAELDGALLWG
jgi:prephenate dehydratase/chorismate mutase/prephenate dehydratase